MSKLIRTKKFEMHIGMLGSKSEKKMSKLIRTKKEIWK